MNDNSVIVNDIYSESIGIHKKFGKDTNDVHYTNEGIRNYQNIYPSFLKSK